MPLAQQWSELAPFSTFLTCLAGEPEAVSINTIFIKHKIVTVHDVINVTTMKTNSSGAVRMSIVIMRGSMSSRAMAQQGLVNGLQQRSRPACKAPYSGCSRGCCDKLPYSSDRRSYR